MRIAPGRDGDAVYEVKQADRTWKVSAAGASGLPEKNEDGFKVGDTKPIRREPHRKIAPKTEKPYSPNRNDYIT
eukprot:1109683-Amphidinium_carterae.1